LAFTLTLTLALTFTLALALLPPPLLQLHGMEGGVGGVGRTGGAGGAQPVLQARATLAVINNPAPKMAVTSFAKTARIKRSVLA
jgi:hypothetical protein